MPFHLNQTFSSLPVRYAIVAGGVLVQAELLSLAAQGVTPSALFELPVLAAVLAFLVSHGVVFWSMLNFKTHKSVALSNRLQDIGPTVLASFAYAGLIVSHDVSPKRLLVGAFIISFCACSAMPRLFVPALLARFRKSKR